MITSQEGSLEVGSKDRCGAWFSGDISTEINGLLTIFVGWDGTMRVFVSALRIAVMSDQLTKPCLVKDNIKQTVKDVLATHGRHPNHGKSKNILKTKMRMID